uniref:Uncharacterized protein n=1 Tax=Trichogramma kaykai TaxID=54128 RepID=A0ABD2XQ33_9HYME
MNRCTGGGRRHRVFFGRHGRHCEARVRANVAAWKIIVSTFVARFRARRSVYTLRYTQRRIRIAYPHAGKIFAIDTLRSDAYYNLAAVINSSAAALEKQKKAHKKTAIEPSAENKCHRRADENITCAYTDRVYTYAPAFIVRSPRGANSRISPEHACREMPCIQGVILFLFRLLLLLLRSRL